MKIENRNEFSIITSRVLGLCVCVFCFGCLSQKRAPKIGGLVCQVSVIYHCFVSIHSSLINPVTIDGSMYETVQKYQAVMCKEIFVHLKHVLFPLVGTNCKVIVQRLLLCVKQVSGSVNEVNGKKYFEFSGNACGSWMKDACACVCIYFCAVSCSNLEQLHSNPQGCRRWSTDAQRNCSTAKNI